MLLVNLHVASYANMQTFPPSNGGDRRGQGYQTLSSPTGGMFMLSNFFMSEYEMDVSVCSFLMK